MVELSIVAATSPEQMGDVRELPREYQARIGVDLCFQGFGRCSRHKRIRIRRSMAATGDTASRRFCAMAGRVPRTTGTLNHRAPERIKEGYLSFSPG